MLTSTIIHTKTEHQFRELLRYLEKLVYAWSDGKSATSQFSLFSSYGDRTCLNIGNDNKRLTYANTNFYGSEQDYTIISFEQYMREHSPPERTNLNRKLIQSIKDIKKEKSQ